MKVLFFSSRYVFFLCYVRQVKTRPPSLWPTQSSANQWTLRASVRACLCITPPSSRTQALWLTCRTSGLAPVCHSSPIQSIKEGIICECFIHSLILPFSDPVSRKSVKSAHSTRNRYSSQWTLTKCQASTPARTLTSDWRTVGSQHGITVTESDSYSASLSQDTGPHTHTHISSFKNIYGLISHKLPTLKKKGLSHQHIKWSTTV